MPIEKYDVLILGGGNAGMGVTGGDPRGRPFRRNDRSA